ncbi:MAG: regulator SirB [Gammaproteobacteria bacterium]|nr:MAG: regulator SirB [Gammaproteobacteria bacterium]
MTLYSIIKLLHQATAVITVFLFVLRGIWLIRESPLLHKRWVRIVPHVNDSILLACAIGLCVLIRQYPFVHHWLTAKVILLVLYIGLGLFVMRSKAAKKVRIIVWFSALVVIGLIATIAITKQPFIVDIKLY